MNTLKLKIDAKGIFSLFVSALLISSFVWTLNPFSAHASSGRAIDLFCQRSPYGRGANQSGGKYQFGELIILYALVTYNDYPIENELVSFEVHGPTNSYEDTALIRTSYTDASGIAEINFRIGLPSEDSEGTVIETWSATAVVDIAEERVADTLTFQLYSRIRILHPRFGRFLETIDNILI